MADPFGSFDAEIEFWIGRDIDNMEKHIITEPTIIRIPPYTWHCPLEYKRVGKPVYFEVLHLRGKFGTFMRRFDDDGKPYLVYTGANGHKPCVLEKGKQCTFCGRCWKQHQDAEEAKKALNNSDPDKS